MPKYIAMIMYKTIRVYELTLKWFLCALLAT